MPVYPASIKAHPPDRALTLAPAKRRQYEALVYQSLSNQSMRPYGTLAVTLALAKRRQYGIRRARHYGACAPQAPAAEKERQYLYFTSKASKLSTSASLLGSVAMLEAPLVWASIITKSARSAERPATCSITTHTGEHICASMRTYI